MKDELHTGNKIFRRVRKHVGESWKPERRVVNAEYGVYCRRCGSVHPWRNRRTLGVKFEKRSSGNWWELWYCMKTGDVLKEIGLENHAH